MSDRASGRSLTLVAGVLVIAALRASYAVTMPIAAALVIIAAIWPVRIWLGRVLPARVSTIGTIVILLAVSLSFLVAVYFSAAQVVGVFAEHWTRFESIYENLTAAAAQWGLPLGGKEGYARLVGFAQSFLGNAYTISVYLGFIALLVSLGLAEVPTMRRNVQEALSGAEHQEVTGAIDEISLKIREYLATTTLTSLITGGATALWALAMGLDLALVWGMLNFLLNYVPMIGNIVGIIPPSLYALIQFSGSTTPVIIFLGFAVIQLTVSNIVYPVMQGRSLSLSPSAIVVALSFWSWLWGVAGALLAIPLTVAIVIACEHFPRTRWIATMVSGRR